MYIRASEHIWCVLDVLLGMFSLDSVFYILRQGLYSWVKAVIQVSRVVLDGMTKFTQAEKFKNVVCWLELISDDSFHSFCYLT